MKLESSILARTRLRQYRLCLALLQAYADLAPWWERLALLGYCGLGTWGAERCGVDTAAMWKKGESILKDVLAASGRSLSEIAALLRKLVLMRLKGDSALSFEEAKEHIYDQFYYPVGAHMTFAVQPSGAARLKFVLQSVAETGIEQGWVADLGCGPGLMLSEILLSQPAWKGFGIDISHTATDYARRLAVHKGVSDRVEIREGDVSRLPYPTGSMDVVVASEVLEHVPEVGAALREIVRVLRSGGRAVITLPMETCASTHIHSMNGEKDARTLLEGAGLDVLRSEVRRERLSYGDDPAHLFLLAQARGERDGPLAAGPMTAATGAQACARPQGEPYSAGMIAP